MHRHVSFGSARISYLEDGPVDGPVALLLHGFPDTPHGFSAHMPTLVDAGYRVVAPFSRGYAPSTAPSLPVTLDQLVADAKGLLDEVGAQRAVVIGHDWGAATAYALAAQHPERLSALVAIGLPHPGTIRPSWRVVWGGRHFLTLLLPGSAAWMRRRGVEVLTRRWSPTWDVGPAELADVVRCLAVPGSAEAAVSYYRGNDRRRTLELVRPRIPVPTLVVAGRDDPALGVDDYLRAARRFTGRYEVAPLPGGHFVHRESSDAFLERLLAFLSSVAPA